MANTEKTKVEIFSFDCGSEVREFHVMIHVDDPELSFQQQFEAVQNAYYELRKDKLKDTVAVFERYYISDAPKQADLLNAAIVETVDCAVSIIQQPPLNGSKVALWVYLQSNVLTRTSPTGLYESCHGAYRHLWCGGATKEAANSEFQARLILNDYVLQLVTEGCKMADNCVRTWFYANDIANDYPGVVKARNNVFYTQDMNPKTHFIVSTAIGGNPSAPHSQVQMDAYAVFGITKEQTQYLYAPTHLDLTSEHGMSFERGVAITYGDRKHVFISSTGGISNTGNVLDPNNACKQTLRTLENIEALLAEAGCDLNDIAQLTVSLRNPADYPSVRKIIEERLQGKPCAMVQAQIFRTERLVEIECMAVKKADAPQFAAL